MNNQTQSILIAALAMLGTLSGFSAATAAPPPVAREIYVPFEELNVLLEGPVRRVLMSREEYDALLVKAQKNPTEKLPHEAAFLSADYDVRLEDLRAMITAKLTCDVLGDGLQSLPFDLGYVGIQEALLDGKPAMLRRNEAGKLMLVLEGRGRHELTLKMFALLETNASEQTLNVWLPKLPSSRLRVSAEGNVEVRSGADLISRAVDEKSGRTQLELLPTDGTLSLALSLNNRTRRQQKVVVARSVVVDEVTAAYERLHATVSLSILHQAVDKFRFAIPDGFEISEVQSPLLARWSTTTADGKRVLEVALRQETTEGVVLNIAAVRSPARLEAWTFPKLEPLDVVGRMSVVGLLLEDRLKAEDVAAEGMLPIDNEVLTQALPASVFAAEPGAPRVRPVVAYYAPDGSIDMKAKFTRPPARVSATTNLLLTVTEQGLNIRGGFALTAEAEALHEFDFSVPAGWTVTEVTGDDGGHVPFERYGNADAAARIHVRLNKKIAAAATGSVYFQATAVPGAWLDAWTTTNLEFPVFAVVGAAIDNGALSVVASDDITVRPDVMTNLTQLDEAEQPKYGLAKLAGQLAYRYDAPGYHATLTAERTKPRLIARTYSFFRVDSDVLTAHYELVYDIARARSRRLEFVLPASTPAAVTLRGLDGLILKEYTSADVDGARRWSALLSEAAQGRVRLAVDFQQPLPKETKGEIALPIVRAEGVAYQSGVVAVEGNAEIDVQVVKHPRKVDVGELAEAEYPTGRRLLGAFGFVGNESTTVISVARHPAYGLQPAIVQSVRYVTVLGGNGRAQTSADFQLRTKAGYLEAKLPAGSTLWSVILDGQTTQPQREGDRLLLSFPASEGEKLRTLKIAYETETARLVVFGRVQIPALGLFLRSTPNGEPQEVPTADARWELHLPSHYRVLRSQGTLTSETAARSSERLAITNVAGLLYGLGGGADIGVSQARRGAMSAQESPDLDHLPSRMSSINGSLSGEASLGERRKKFDRIDLAQSSDETRRIFDELEKRTELQYLDTQLADVVNDVELRHKINIELDLPALAAQGITPQSIVNKTMKDLTLKAALDLVLGEYGLTYVIENDVLIITTKAAAAVRSEPMSEAKPGEPTTATGRSTRLPGGMGGGGFGGGLGGGLGGGAGGFGQPVPAAPPAAVAMPATPTAAPKSAPSVVPAKPAPKLEKFGGKGSFDLAGVRSLKIDLQSTNDVAVFQSLGIDPRLDVTIVDERRADGIALVVALAVFLYGAFLACAPTRRKLRYVAIVGTITTLVPLVAMRQELVPLMNPSFYAACLLLPYYAVVRAVCWTIGKLRPRLHRLSLSLPLGMLLLSFTGAAMGAEPAAQVPDNKASGGAASGSTAVVVQVVAPLPPVKVPDDAVILLYQDMEGSGRPRADQLLVPYDRYQELTNQAYPQKRAAPRPPTPYSIAGAAFKSTLEGDDFLLIEGWIDYELFTEEFVQIPLPLVGGVLASAKLDGKPARLNFAKPPVAKPEPQQPLQQRSAAPAPPAPAPLMLIASGKGRHRLELTVRLTLEKVGGWRIAEGLLPVAPATSLTLTVPQTDTDLRLGGIPDRRNYTTTKPNEAIATALGADGALRIEWRAKINAAQVDDSLKARSDVVFAVQDDGLRLAWRTALEFGAVRRERFTVVVPKDYLVERVTGRNVRGWEPREVGDERKLDIELLRPASNNEEFAIFLSRRTHFDAMPTDLPVPVVGIEGAAVHNGNVSIRRSSILDLRTTEATGLSRIDTIDGIENAPATADRNDVSPLGMRNYESYRFVAVPFTLKLTVVPLVSKSTAEINSILKIAERERNFETQIKLRVTGAPIHRFRAYLPDGLRLDQVTVTGTFEWAVTTVEGRPLLTIYFAAGQTGAVEVLLAGLFGKPGPTLTVPVPRLEVLDVERQEGHLVVQIDPAFDVQPVDLRGCEQELLDRTFGWLREAQRPLARIAIRTTSGDYGGTIQLTVRKPTVRCQTITNVRVTDRAIEETILLDFTIRDAGVREVVFLLPAALADAKIDVPQLREKKIEPVGTDGKLIRVRLQLQDEVMGQLRVLVESDRPRTSEAQTATIPTPETGRTEARFVTLEGFGRDELVVDKTTGLEPLGRQQQQWQVVAGLLRGGATQAYLVEPAAVDPQLTYLTRSRDTVETVGARIGLAEAMLVVDEFGAYRAVQTYRIDNKTEQFLTVELPEGSMLWTAWVAGEPVKPIPVLPPTAAREIRIPLVKTAEGDLDYEVKLVYGWKLAAPKSFTEVSFPLIRTVNVKVELSQVRLYLPESFDWVDFGGTMKLVKDEAVLQAGNIAYFNKSTEKLAQTLERGDEFAKARASNSLRELKSDIGSMLNLSGANSYTGATTINAGVLQQELDRNERVWKEAEKQQQTHAAQQLPQSNTETLTIQNSAALNSAYSFQSNARAKNVVTGLGNNFDVNAPQPATPTTKTERFDRQWLNSNGLVTMNGGTGEQDGRLTKSGAGTITLNAGTLNLGNSQLAVPQIASGKAKEGIDKDQAAAGEMNQLARQRDGDAKQAAQVYERRLSEQSKLNVAQRGIGPHGLLEDSRTEQLFGKPGTSAGDMGRGMATRKGVQGAEFAGLAGLEVEIPKRGNLYRFSTPLDDARITARPIAASLVGNLERLALTGVLLIIALVVWRFVRKIGFAWFHETRAGALAVIGAGVLSLITFTLPLFGAALLFIGILMLLRRLTLAVLPT